MKKRSLFAAAAMLIVSAIVLTSATYAWFSSSTTATAQTFTGTVTNGAGAVKISADGVNWTNSLSHTEVAAAQANSIASTLNPVSIGVSTAATPVFSVVNGSISSGTFTSGGATAGTDYTEFVIHVKSEQAGTVRVSASNWSANSGFTYFMVRNSSNQYFLSGNGSDAYDPVISQGSTTDTNGNDIIDSGEVGGGVTLGTQMQTSSNAYLDLVWASGEEGTTKDVTVDLWAEGNDAQCSGAVNATPSLALQFVIQ